MNREVRRIDEEVVTASQRWSQCILDIELLLDLDKNKKCTMNQNTLVEEIGKHTGGETNAFSPLGLSWAS